MAQSIDYFSKQHPLRRFATAIALRAREQMFARFARTVPFDERTTLLDVGVTPDQDLADSNFFERLYPYPDRLTATSIEDASFLEQRYPGLRFVRTDGTGLPFEEGEFGIAFSSAVLEHVGDRSSQRRFLAEICRVADRFYITTPNRWFPVELHTFIPLLHWLPQHWHQAILRRLGKAFWAETANLNLVSAREFVALFPPGTTVRVDRHRTLGWTSNLIAHGRVIRPTPPPS